VIKKLLQKKQLLKKVIKIERHSLEKFIKKSKKTINAMINEIKTVDKKDYSSIKTLDKEVKEYKKKCHKMKILWKNSKRLIKRRHHRRHHGKHHHRRHHGKHHRRHHKKHHRKHHGKHHHRRHNKREAKLYKEFITCRIALKEKIVKLRKSQVDVIVINKRLISKLLTTIDADIRISLKLKPKHKRAKHILKLFIRYLYSYRTKYQKKLKSLVVLSEVSNRKLKAEKTKNIKKSINITK